MGGGGTEGRKEDARAFLSSSECVKTSLLLFFFNVFLSISMRAGAINQVELFGEYDIEWSEGRMTAKGYLRSYHQVLKQQRVESYIRICTSLYSA